MNDPVTHRKHALIGRTISEAIKCIEWGNGGKCKIRDYRSSRRLDENVRGDIPLFTVTVFVKDGIVVRVGG